MGLWWAFLLCLVKAQTTIQNTRNLVSVTLNGNLTETYSVWNSSQKAFFNTLSYQGPNFILLSTTSSFTVKWFSVSRVANDTIRVLGNGSCIGSSPPSCLANISRTIILSDDGFHITMEAFNFGGKPLQLASVEDWYTFQQLGSPTQGVESVFSQSIKHQSDAIVPHWQFKSPSVILQQNNIFAAVVMDINDEMCEKENLQNLPPFMDLRNNGNSSAQFAAALGPSKLTMHSVYSRTLDGMIWEKNLRLVYYLLIGSNVTQRTDLGSFTSTSSAVVTQFLWKMFGHPRLLATPDMQSCYSNSSLNTFDVWRAKTWYSTTDNYYFEFPCNGSSTCSSLRGFRNQWADHVGNDNDAWFNAWFQSLRTAYGWYAYGNRIGDSKITERAKGVVNLALLAPNPTGAFPSIFWLTGNPSLDTASSSSLLFASDTCKPVSLPPNTNLVGDDYYHFAVTEGDPASVCQAACCNDIQCLSWTVVNPWTSVTTNCPAGSICCWLKSGVPATTACPECTSGTMGHDASTCTTKRLPTKTDIQGGDYTNFPITSTDPSSACEAACCGDLNCAAWVLTSPQPSVAGPCPQGSDCCWLKKSVPPQTPCDFCTGGIVTRPSILNWVDDSGWAGLCNLLPASSVPPNCMEYFHSFDMSWTGWWLFRWQKSFLSNDTRIVQFLVPLGDFFVTHQNPQTGVIPSWYKTNEEGNPPSPFFGDMNAETAGAALFLLELYNHTLNASYLTSAKKALIFLEENIIVERKWWDFETFMSCSPKPLDFYDSYTRQFPQNTLSKFQAAFAFLRMYEITNDNHFLAVGIQIVDYTALIQQVWSHPLLTPHLLGGFSSQNTDSEWSDARQAHAAEMYFGYYKWTNNIDYLERGVAAMRSGFAVSPYENWAHTGGSEGDVPGALSSFHWGEGSILATVEMFHDWLKDAYINLKGGLQHGVGVNGCSISNLTVDAPSKTITFSLITKYTWSSPLVVVVDIESSTTLWTLIVNGKTLGSYTTNQLSQGIPISANVISLQ